VNESFFLHSSKARPPLRIGVLIDSERLAAPLAAVLDHIAASDFARLALVIRNTARQQTRPTTARALRLVRHALDKRARGRFAYARYAAWDRRRHAATHALIRDVDCAGHFDGLPSIEVEPIAGKAVDRFPQEAVEAIRAHDLDVILRFGFRILRGDVLEAARCGVWSYHHGDPARFRGSPPGFWELVEREPLSGAVLQRLTEKLDDGIVLAKTLAPTNFGISVLKNVVPVYQAAEPLVIMALHQLHEHGWEGLLARAPKPEPYSGRKRIYRIPSVSRLTRFVAREVLDHRLRQAGLMPRIGHGHWRTALRRLEESGARPWEGDWSDFNWLSSRAHCFADPHLFEHDGRTWLFGEKLMRKGGNAFIGCAEVLDNGSLGEMRPVLERPYHLSMPHVFGHQGAIFMIPEAAQSGRIELYRAVDFPYRWRLEKVLLDKPGLDTVVLPDTDGSFYFFTSLRHKPETYPSLFLFRAEGLFEPWRLHPASPLSLDVRYARNAGAPFRVGNELYRASQDLTLFYGRQMHFHRIERLNPREYLEEMTGQRAASPAWGKAAIGTHTYTRTGKWEAIDGYFLGQPA
jgi:hypothetical protein